VSTMEARVDRTGLPFAGLASTRRLRGKEIAGAESWNPALRHLDISFHTDDRLTLISGHPLVTRLSVSAATDRALAGEPVVYLDGAHSFDPFIIGRLAKARRQQPRKVLALIHVARAFSGYQMERLISNCLAAALDRYQARTAVISGLCDMMVDEAASDRDIARLSDRMLESIRQLLLQGYSFLCPVSSVPAVDARGHQLFAGLSELADRLIRVQEKQGNVLVEEDRPILHAACTVQKTAPERLI
jgi:hypothetical protein